MFENGFEKCFVVHTMKVNFGSVIVCTLLTFIAWTHLRFTQENHTDLE